MAKAKTAAATESEILRGMKAICDFMRMSEATVLKYCREYDDFPVKKNGGYISHRSALNQWLQDYLTR